MILTQDFFKECNLTHPFLACALNKMDMKKLGAILIFIFPVWIVGVFLVDGGTDNGDTDRRETSNPKARSKQ
jgi:hypothetical protein